VCGVPWAWGAPLCLRPPLSAHPCLPHCASPQPHCSCACPLRLRPGQPQGTPRQRRLSRAPPAALALPEAPPLGTHRVRVRVSLRVSFRVRGGVEPQPKGGALTSCDRTGSSSSLWSLLGAEGRTGGGRRGPVLGQQAPWAPPGTDQVEVMRSLSLRQVRGGAGGTGLK